MEIQPYMVRAISSATIVYAEQIAATGSIEKATEKATAQAKLWTGSTDEAALIVGIVADEYQFMNRIHQITV